jgi:hypothetical protein
MNPAQAFEAVVETGEELTNRRFGRAAPPRPPNPPRRACTSAARAAPPGDKSESQCER